MKYSNLAERLEEFAATVEAPGLGEQKPTVVLSFVPEGPLPTPQPAPRRRAFGTRRIEIRDEGLRPFRVS
jgi:hypothetical protein